MDDNETVSPFVAQELPGSLQVKFAAAKARLQEAKDALNGVLKEMVAAGQAKVIEDNGGEFPDITIVASRHLLDLIESYDFQSDSATPSWLDGDGCEVYLRGHEDVEWF
jgi:hypothetical protein